MLSNSLEFKRSLVTKFDPDTDYSQYSEAEIEGAFEATLIELLYHHQKQPEFAEIAIPEAGDTVQWNYGKGQGVGRVQKVFTESVSRKLGESAITRNGTKENPALLIAQDGAQVLKLASEVKILREVELEEPVLAYSFEDGGKYSHIDLTPTKGMIEAAKQAKRYIDEGFAGDGMEPETVRWVNMVASGKPLSIEKAKKGYKFFKRQNYYKKTKNEGDTNPANPAPWYVARMAWFGDDGEKFFNRVWRQIQAADAETMDNSEPVEFGSIIHKVIKWNGFDIGCEFTPGQVRFPGRKHSKKLRSGYGHLRNCKSSVGDKEALDCYLAPAFFDGGTPSDRCFEVIQISPEDGDFDEFKEMIAYESLEDAKNAYLQEMPEEYFGGIREISLQELGKYRQTLNYAELEQAIAQALQPHLEKIEELTSRIAEFTAPIQLTGDVLTKEEFEQLADINEEDVQEAVKDWEATAPEEYKSLLEEDANT